MPRGSRLRVDVHVSPRARRREPVAITLRLTNTGRKPVELHLQGRQTVFDVVVTGAGGAVVWRRLAGTVHPAILQLRVLAPGEALELTASWDQRDADGRLVPAGEYFVHGELPTDSPTPLRSTVAPLHIEA